MMKNTTTKEMHSMKEYKPTMRRVCELHECPYYGEMDKDGF